MANSGNGGSNVRNIKDYINGYLQKKVNLPITKFGLIIYQFTSHDRDYINQRYTKEGKLTGDVMPIEEQIKIVNKEIIKWESLGVKVVTLSWYEEFPNHPLYQKYFKDILDHITQANELAESYRDMMMNLQDLYLSHVNLKSNEVMKVMAVVTCLLAPATVIGGMFGMNFDNIPYLHHQYGFFIAVGLMLFVPIWMVVVFKRRGWF